MITASIVAFHQSYKEMSQVLDCVLASSVSIIYIIDNSLNDALRTLENVSDKVRYIHSVNIGYGGAHNVAIREAIEKEATYHVVINPDIQFSEGTIEALTEYMDNNAEVGLVMPRVVSPDGELQYLCKLLPTPMDLIGRRFLPVNSYVEKNNYRYEMRESGYDKTLEVPFLSGCFMFLRVDALSLVGGFSDRYWMYCEDIDLCRRIGERYKTMYYPRVTIIHAHKKESFKSKKMLKEHIKSAVKYFNYWGWIFDKQRTRRNRSVREQY